MKKLHISKTAGALAIVMICSLLLPVFAFAATYFGTLNSNVNGTVTGDVYTDDFATVQTDVYGNPTHIVVDVRDVNGNVLTTTDATYTSFDGTYYHFNLNYNASVTFGTYNPITFATDGTVSENVYRNTSSGGGVFIPPGSGGLNDGTINVVNGGQVTAFELEMAFNQSDDITINIADDSVNLPASALAAQAEENPDSTVTVVHDGATYTLPLSVIDFDQLAADLGVTLDGLNIVIGIETLTGAEANTIQAAVTAEGGTVIAPIVDFTLYAEANGQTINIDSFGSTYVERTIEVNQITDGSNATGVVVDPVTGEISFVPSTFAQVNGETIATIKRNSNSIYTVIANTKSFDDVSAASFAKADIDLLASKLIIAGVSDTEFQPNRNITRAEFAALIVRSLGLNADSTESSFSDLEAGKWYVKEVAAAEAAGLVAGYTDGTFRPDQSITRQELAALVVRALQYANGSSEELSEADQASALASFSDAASIGNWAKAELALAIQEEIVFGYPNNTVAPANNATRAETAAMIERFLSNVGFIN